MTGMHSDTLIFSIFLIFTGAAIVATLVLFTRQSLLVAYILLGIVLGPWGPWGAKLVAYSTIVRQIGDIGIIFLLFLLGLHLPPQKLIHMFRKTTIVAITSSIIFVAVGYVIGKTFGFSNQESLIIGAAMMFSSTIIGLKLLPTTVLHHRHTGELMISVLLLQDLLAIIVLIFLHGASYGGISWIKFGFIFISLPVLIAMATLFERFILTKLFAKFDRIQEYVFLLSIGWCLSLAELAGVMELSHEIGAFIAGVSIAASPIALYIAESLKPLRDFFLVMFFFSIGTNFNLNYVPQIAIPAILLATIVLLCKPLVFKYLLQWVKEPKQASAEVGIRLGQASEFSLLVAYLASGAAFGKTLIGQNASCLIQAATILTFMVSSYWVVARYPTPVATSDKLRRD
jgi:Kef-type K+ transport system membrane component KefB